MGLREKILKSTSKEELETLLELANKFGHPSERTKRSWIRAYKKRFVELNSPIKKKNEKKKLKNN
tara:strand:- start:1742 stop:1936 length:195 start_codon:yes stop_codon:yes gene_type:complete